MENGRLNVLVGKKQGGKGKIMTEAKEEWTQASSPTEGPNGGAPSNAQPTPSQVNDGSLDNQDEQQNATSSIVDNLHHINMSENNNGMRWEVCRMVVLNNFLFTALEGEVGQVGEQTNEDGIDADAKGKHILLGASAI